MQRFAELWPAIQDLPRHLGQHSGGMVIAQGRLDSVAPLEPASMPGRSVVQWDKDDCGALGMVKVDLLGLGMMSLLQDAIQMIEARGGHLDLAHLPPDDAKVYGMLQEADTIGVFQVESRAQMATLPRLRPTCFYDLVVEVAIIRPGPIMGDMVHPYLRRRAGREEKTVPHPRSSPSWRAPSAYRSSRSSSCAWPWPPPASRAARPRSCGGPWASSARSGPCARSR